MKNSDINNYNEKLYDIAVIGGGAGGFAAAISAAECGILNIAILEGGERTGRKIAASGNGQGNIANKNLSVNNYHGKNTDIVKKVFDKVPYQRLIKFYESTGIVVTEKERDRIYPSSLQASSVLDCLRLKAKELSIEEICGFLVTDIIKEKDYFKVAGKDDRIIYAKKVIVSCGGAAAPHLSSGTGYDLLTKFGHKLNKLMPSLVQLKTEKERLKYLKGIRAEAALTAFSDGQVLKTASGDIIFTDYGISGSAVFDISGAAVRALEENKTVYISIDMMQNIDIIDLKNILKKRRDRLNNRTAESFFTGFIIKQSAKSILTVCGINLSKNIKEITDKEIEAMVLCIKNFRLSVTGSLGFENAQVTAGGIDTADFDDNLMSKLCRNLYVCGEMLDIDGDCGGYNLMWAFAGGIVCGTSAAKAIKNL